jgi:regulator of RNase E activity RraB
MKAIKLTNGTFRGSIICPDLCPYCGSDNLDYLDEDTDGDYLVERIMCRDCYLVFELISKTVIDSIRIKGYDQLDPEEIENLKGSRVFQVEKDQIILEA